MRRRNLLQIHLAGLGIEPSQEVCLFVGEPQHTVVIKNRCMWVNLGTVGWAVLLDLSVLRIQSADVTTRYCDKPDIAIFVRDQPVWT